MKKRKFMAVLAVTGAILVSVSLTGCGESLSERVENRDMCEKAGGEYVEYVNNLTYTYQDWDCNLSTKEED